MSPDGRKVWKTRGGIHATNSSGKMNTVDATRLDGRVIEVNDLRLLDSNVVIPKLLSTPSGLVIIVVWFGMEHEKS